MVWQYLVKLAERKPRSEAAREFVQGSLRTISYEELLLKCIQCAERIHATTTEGIIATKMQRGIDWYIIYWATIYLHRPIVSLSIDLENKQDEADRERSVLDILKPSVILTELPIRTTDESTPISDIQRNADDILMYCFTGGTTAKSKLVGVTYRMALWELEQYPNLLNKHSHDVDSIVLQPSSFFWGAAVFGTIDVALALGGSVCFVEDIHEPDTLVSVINQSGASVIGIVPYFLEQIAPERLPGVHTVISWAERCPPEVARKWADKVSVFYDFLIASEYWLCFFRITGAEFSVLPGADIVVVQQEQDSIHLVARGELGELCVRGPMVFGGFGHPPSLDCFAEVLTDGKPLLYYRTGDLVRQRGDASFTHHGRVQSAGLCKVAGKWIDLDSIVDEIVRPPGEVKIIKDDETGQYYCFATSLIDESMLPLGMHVIYVARIPRKSTGKVDMQRLLDLVRPSQRLPSAFPKECEDRRQMCFWLAMLVAASTRPVVRVRMRALPYLMHYIWITRRKNHSQFWQIVMFMLTARNSVYWLVAWCASTYMPNMKRRRHWPAVFWLLTPIFLTDSFANSFLTKWKSKEQTNSGAKTVTDPAPTKTMTNSTLLHAASLPEPTTSLCSSTNMTPAACCRDAMKDSASEKRGQAAAKVGEMVASILRLPSVTDDFELFNLDSIRQVALARGLGLSVMHLRRAGTVGELAKVVGSAPKVTVQDPQRAKVFLYALRSRCGWLVKLPRDLDENSLRKALLELPKRHPALRAWLRLDEKLYNFYRKSLGMLQLWPLRPFMDLVVRRGIWLSWPEIQTKNWNGNGKCATYEGWTPQLWQKELESGSYASRYPPTFTASLIKEQKCKNCAFACIDGKDYCCEECKEGSSIHSSPTPSTRTPPTDAATTPRSTITTDVSQSPCADNEMKPRSATSASVEPSCLAECATNGVSRRRSTTAPAVTPPLSPDSAQQVLLCADTPVSAEGCSLQADSAQSCTYTATCGPPIGFCPIFSKDDGSAVDLTDVVNKETSSGAEQRTPGKRKSQHSQQCKRVKYDAENKYLHLHMSHAFTDQASISPLIQDLQSLYENHGSTKPPPPAYDDGIRLMQDRLRQTVLYYDVERFGRNPRGENDVENIFAAENVVKWPHKQKVVGLYGMFGTAYTDPLKKWCMMHAKSFEVVLCSLFVITLARVYYKPHELTQVPVSFVAPLRDGLGEADAVALLVDWRTLDIPVSSDMSVRGVVEFTTRAVRERRWLMPVAAHDHERLLINVVPIVQPSKAGAWVPEPIEVDTTWLRNRDWRVMSVFFDETAKGWLMQLTWRPRPHCSFEGFMRGMEQAGRDLLSNPNTPV